MILAMATKTNKLRNYQNNPKPQKKKKVYSKASEKDKQTTPWSPEATP